MPSDNFGIGNSAPRFEVRDFTGPVQSGKIQRTASKASPSAAGEGNLYGIKCEETESEIENGRVSESIDSARTSFESESVHSFVSLNRDSLNSNISDDDDGPSYHADLSRESLDSVTDERYSENDGPSYSANSEDLDRLSIDSQSDELTSLIAQGQPLSSAHSAEAVGGSSAAGSSSKGNFFGRFLKWISDAVSSFSTLSVHFSFPSLPRFFGNSSSSSSNSRGSDVINPFHDSIDAASSLLKAWTNVDTGKTTPAKQSTKQVFTRLYVDEKGRRLTGAQLKEEGRVAPEQAANKAQKEAEEKALAAPLEARKSEAAEATIKKDEITNIQGKYFSVCEKLADYNLKNNTKLKDATGTERKFISDDSKKKYQRCTELILKVGELIDQHALQATSIEHAQSFRTNKGIVGLIKKNLLELQKENQTIRDELFKTINELDLKDKNQTAGCKALVETISGPFEERIKAALKTVDQTLEAIKQHPNDPIDQAVMFYLGKEIGQRVIGALDSIAENIFNPVMENVVEPAVDLLPSSYREKIMNAASFAGDVEANR